MKRLGLIPIFYCCWSISLGQEVVEVTAGKHARKDVMEVKIKKPLSLKGTYQLTNTKTGKAIPAQLADSVTVVFIPEKIYKAGTTHSYKLTSAKVKSGNPVKVEKQENGLLVKVKGKPLFFYHTSIAMPPADSPSYYKRSGFIHPLFSPDGNILTDDFPAGHAHQHGIFMTWVNNTFKNQKVDFWNQHSKTGTVEHVQVIDITEGPVFSRIRTKLRHVSLQHGPVLEEIWTITIYPFTDKFIFDLESEQVNITSDTLFLNRHPYGGLAFRGSRQWNRHDSLHFKNHWRIITSEGKDNTTANHTHARWVDASGKLDDKLCGVTVFGHPANFRYPQAIRLHPDMPYWAFAPVIDGPFPFNPGMKYRSRFRYYVHRGNADVGEIERMMNEWITD